MKKRTTKESRDSRRLQRAAVALRELPKSYRLRDMPGILSHQRSWLDAAFAADIDLASLSAARGSGKSTLAGWIAACFVAPQGELHAPGGAVLIVAPTMGQGRECLIAARGFLEGEPDLRVEGFGGEHRRPSSAHGVGGPGLGRVEQVSAGLRRPFCRDHFSMRSGQLARRAGRSLIL